MNGLERLRLESRAEITYKFVKGALKLEMDARTIADTFGMDAEEVEKIIERLRQEDAQQS